MLMSTITTVRNTQNTANPAILNLMNLTMNLTKYISIIDKDMLFVVLYTPSIREPTANRGAHAVCWSL